MRHRPIFVKPIGALGLQTQVGITLVELIISMLVISIALTGVLSVMHVTVRHSVDPLVNHQAIAIAESYLEEILLQAYSDPDGSEVGETRATYDDVDDYDGLSDTGVIDQQGSAVVGLENYNVSVVVSSALTLAGAVQAKKITVSVSSAAVNGIDLVGYRAEY